jgi:hypothetical protein
MPETIEIPVDEINRARLAAGKDPLQDVEDTVTVSVQGGVPDDAGPAAPGPDVDTGSDRYLPRASTLARTTTTYFAVGAGVALGSVVVSYYSDSSNGIV